MEPLRSTLPDDGFASDDESMQSKCLKRSGFILMGIVSVYAGATLWAGRGGWQLALTAISPSDILIIVGLVSIGFLLRAGSVALLHPRAAMERSPAA